MPFGLRDGREKASGGRHRQQVRAALLQRRIRSCEVWPTMRGGSARMRPGLFLDAPLTVSISERTCRRWLLQASQAPTDPQPSMLLSPSYERACLLFPGRAASVP
ncbi:hypothetical protein MTO96_042937 [Rhipicephalus appendiculatus]